MLSTHVRDATQWRSGGLSQVDEWIASEQASPALDAVFRASAEALLDDLLTDDAIYYLLDWTLGVVEAEGRTTEDIAALITLATEGSPIAGERVLPFAMGLHHAPLIAIGAQALAVGDESQQRRAVALFRDLAQTDVAEYAVALYWPISSAVLPDSDRRYWREFAEREWPPSVRGLHGDWGSMISFGMH
jgi:hypothetical protein